MRFEDGSKERVKLRSQILFVQVSIKWPLKSIARVQEPGKPFDFVGLVVRE